MKKKFAKCKITKSLVEVSCGETIQHNGRRCPLNVTGAALLCAFEFEFEVTVSFCLFNLIDLFTNIINLLDEKGK